jgi:hypothetical protein
VVRIGGREAQDSRCSIYLADVGYGDWFDLVLAWFGCCAVLVGDGVVDYCCHCSFGGGSREMRWKQSRGDGVKALKEHDTEIYAIIVIVGIV